MSFALLGVLRDLDVSEFLAWAELAKPNAAVCSAH
jgi:hypothetical protein